MQTDAGKTVVWYEALFFKKFYSLKSSPSFMIAPMVDLHIDLSSMLFGSS